ncbi:hypothetical protein Tco_0637633 [Tanacetum coccineum]
MKGWCIRILPPVTAAEIQAVEKERKAKNILFMAIPKEHMRRFHGMDDAKEIWEAIRTRFGGNANSKKIQKAVFKQQFEAFTISSLEGLEKGYDIFQQLLSQLETHGAKVSTEGANYKFLRSLPPTWSNLAMTMRTKPDVNTLSMMDLYNNLSVLERRKYRVNHANQFVPRSVQLNAGRPNINSVRTNINTGLRVNIGSLMLLPVDTRQPSTYKTSNSFSIKTAGEYLINEGIFSKISLPDHPLKNMVDRGIFYSGCSGHMTGNKDQLEDFEEFNEGSVTFGGSKGYISGKGKIRVGNLDFDSVSFVKELGHFNLFSISQICDKHHKVLFTETECLVVSSDFKMPDENQILLKVPRHHNMYSFDMKTPTPAKGFVCLIAKATSDDSKLWHRRFSKMTIHVLPAIKVNNTEPPVRLS